VNIVILCRSVTGHSKKIAKAIQKAVGVEIKNIKSKPQINGADLAFFVGGIYGGASTPDAIEYAKTLTPKNVKKVALVTSSASDKKGQDYIREILQANGIEIAEREFRCFGSFLFLRLGHPNKKELVSAMDYASKMVRPARDADIPPDSEHQ
jgi:flavodoxin